MPASMPNPKAAGPKAAARAATPKTTAQSGPQSAAPNKASSSKAQKSTVPAAGNKKMGKPLEQDLVKKLGIEKPTAYAVVDTNVSNGRRSAMMEQHADGELETLLLEKVKGKDLDWVKHTLSQCGRELFLSPYAGNIIKTSILYAAENGDSDMCKLLVRYGGKELLLVKNFKGRDARYFAEKHGIDIGKLSCEATVDCWNLNTLNGINGVRRASALSGSSPEKGTEKVVSEGRVSTGSAIGASKETTAGGEQVSSVSSKETVASSSELVQN
mmetsp:Transcript_5319/g.13452  ORF Transcript_5319/g.13452 Transcript_5319/m.13452 type:complete len:271 (-) Transcript_5319:573-1385(-)|eukprot:CAMPEP_0178993998 /NCGR_PEP_ID=MMETSP0795-20121207/7030_1 /TAXON_ID=88552 /ORGANISM="Amoebophrya sp., Strain Ameob2" /LENGTH=270 /DNA_ID=CAMNT_0020686151 /DNA_START=32 /DNA_END=844 /DNA_ORIENTATION=+